MPESVEIPAPVRTTMCRARPMSAAALVEAARTYRATRTAASSTREGPAQ